MSGKVVQISVVRERRALSVEAAWQRYVDAMNRSKETLKLEDGIAAAKAYREFVELYARAG